MTLLLKFFSFLYLTVLLNVSIINVSQSQIDIDYKSGFTDGINTNYLMGYGFNNPGPYIAHGKIWVFYSDGMNAMWKTKQAEAGGEWSGENPLFSLENDKRFAMVFDGKYFHFTFNGESGVLYYVRSKPESDGSMTTDAPVLIYDDETWNVHLTYAIEVDYLKRPWIIATVQSGDESKPIAFSSLDTTGGWIDRPGWPKELQASSSESFHGRGNGVVEIDEGEILFTWRDEINTRMSARLWNADETNPDSEGMLGEIENTQLVFRDGTRTTLISPAEGIAMLNSTNNITTRSSAGTWTNVTPGDRVATRYWNGLSSVDGVVRIWDYSSGKIRYQETDDFGTTWSPVIEKWDAPGVVQVNASETHNSQGDHHSVMWATGSGTFDPPFSLYMGIEGEIPPPPTPMLVSPPDNAMDVSIDVTLSWDESQFATSYDVQVSTNADFSTTIIDEIINDTELLLSDLSINTEHYWRVRAINEFGESDWSEIWSFTTEGIPSAPVLVSPEDGATDESTSPTLSWESIVNVDYYHLQISTVSDFSTLFLDKDTITGYQYEVSGLDNEKTYYWRLRALNEFGEGEWSEVWSFTTKIAVPAAPVLVSPEDDAQNVLTTPTFEWEEADLAETYRIQVSKESNFASTVVNTGGVTDTSIEVEGLEHSTQYYWRVNASNESGAGNWSAVRNFTTIIADPDTPVLVSPADSLEDVSTRPVLQWNESASAETYKVQIATDIEFTAIVLDQTEIDSLQLTVIDELDEFTTHYWRVNATNIGGTSDWSEVWQFTTDQAFPVAPTLVSPADGGSDITDATLLWNSVPTATAYRVQISKEPDFSGSIAVDRDDITNTFFTATNLEKWTTYYWRVRGISHVGQGYWSETRSFETGDIVSVEQIDKTIPDEFALRQNYPNPFNPVTMIQFALPEAATVQLEIYNMLGQRVATLIDGEHHAAGHYEAIWDARDDTGNEVSSGLYIYRISAGNYVNVKKMLFMK